MNQKNKSNVYSEIIDRVTAVIQNNMKIEKQIKAILGKKYEKNADTTQGSLQGA